MSVKGIGYNLVKDKYGRYDIDMTNGDISLVKDTDFLVQVITCVLGTNKKEWVYDIEEGIDFRKILIKNPNFEVIKDEIRQAIFKIDDTLDMTSFNYKFNKSTRKLEINVGLTKSNGENIFLTTNI